MRIVVVMRAGKWRDALVAILREEGWSVDLYSSAREAIQGIERKRVPNVIITELLLSDLDGWKFCYLLRSSEFEMVRGVPIVVASHLYTGEYGEAIARACGADALLSLSGGREMLVATIKKTIAREPGDNALNSVLVVEDDLVLLHLLRKTFEKNGWQVATASSTFEAMEAMASNVPDLIVVDYHLPDVKGDLLLRETARNHPETTCIMITADATPELALDWLEKGAAAYLLKPFSASYLFEIGIRCMREKVWRRVEQQLEERTRLLSAKERFIDDLENSIVDVFWSRNIDSSYKYISPSVINLLGYSQDEAYGLSLEEEMTPESAKRFREVVAIETAVAAANVPEVTPRTEVFEHRHRDGSIIPVETRLKVKTDIFGKPVAIIGITRDISREKDKEERLKLLHSAIGQADDVILITDIEGNVEYVNDAFEQVTGYSPGEVLGQNMNILNSGIHDKTYYDSLWATILGGKNWVGQMTNKRKDGSLYQERVKISPIRNNNGEITRFVAVKHDLTRELELLSEKKAIEAKYMHAQKFEVIGSLATGIIHDFNNILTPIMGYAGLIKLQYSGDRETQDHIEQIHLAGNRAKDLINMILSFARAHSKKQQVLELQHLIKECVKMSRAFFPPKIAIDCELNGVYPQVRIDPSRFSQLLMNLMTNSFHAMEENGGRLSITLEELNSRGNGKKLRMRVVDTGTGIDEKIRDRVFDPFFTTKKEGKGTGLGLSVAKTIANEVGGDIYIEYCGQNKGTAIVVDFPAVLGKKERFQKRRPGGERFNGKKQLVLLVDDDQIVLKYLTAALTRLNFTVDSFLDSRQALEVFLKRKDEYRLLFTDIEMPNKDGLELISDILRVRSDLPIVICTGKDKYQKNGLVEDSSFVRVLTKPVTVSEVSSAMSTLFSETH